MALNVKKREQRVLKSDQMLQDALQQGQTMAETSSQAILDGLNKEIEKPTESLAETIEEKSSEQITKPIKTATKKVGRKKKYLEERDLVHVRITPTDRKDVEIALFARNQNMQDYLMDLIKDDMKKNKDKYLKVYTTLNAFREEFQ